MRYSTAYSHGGYEESWKEMIMDWNRLWVRNLVRCCMYKYDKLGKR